MTGLDRLKDAAVALADAAVKTTGDLAQKGKKQVDMLALENKLSRAQRQLGALVYALDKNGEKNDAIVRQYINSIAEVEKEIAQLAQEQPAYQEDTNVMVYCPQCGTEVDPDAMFCPGCGGKL